jgi:hypothetical protein
MGSLKDKNWTIRRTPERDQLLARVRAKINQSGRQVETIHGVPTTAGIVEEALKELDKQLSKAGK